MDTRGLRGFESLRTRPCPPMDPALIPARRHCSMCHAVLRRSNPGPLCAPCAGGELDDLTDIERHLIDSSTRGAHVVAVMRGYDRRGKVDDRNRAVRELAEEGMSRGDLAERFGVSKGTINDIIWRRYGNT